jgi:hypothetical protein
MISSTQNEPQSSCYEVPVRFVSSHGIESPGFQSRRRGFFWHDTGALREEPFSFEDGDVLGTAVRRLSLVHRGNGNYLLALDFVDPRTMDEAEDFLRCLMDAFTVSMASGQRDPWYGNLSLDANFAGLRDATPRAPGVFSIQASSGMTSEEFIPITREVLEALTWSPLTKLFAEGMRATQPKSKFLFWFVILEELESRKEFKKLFAPLFSADEKKVLRQSALSSEAAQRLDGLLNNPLATQQGRHEKLLTILRTIGLGTVKAANRETILDETICRSLIKQRNNIAHKGANIDPDELYVVLFPLAQGALNYLLTQSP